MKNSKLKSHSEFCSSLDDSNHPEKVHLSLIIDDENSVIIEMNLADNIEDVCKLVVNKYNLNEKVIDKLKSAIEKNIQNVFKHNLIENRIKEKEVVNRLHYEGIVGTKRKLEMLEQKRKDETEKELKKFSFTPTISQNSHKTYKKPFMHFEDKLYYDDMISRNKTKLRRLLKSVENVVECKQFVYKPKSKIKNENSINKNNSRNKIKKENNIEENNIGENNLHTFNKENFTLNSNNNIQKITDKDSTNTLTTIPNFQNLKKQNTIIFSEGEKEEMNKKINFSNKDQSFINNNNNSNGNSYMDRFKNQQQNLTLLNQSNNNSILQNNKKFMKKITVTKSDLISEVEEFDFNKIDNILPQQRNKLNYSPIKDNLDSDMDTSKELSLQNNKNNKNKNDENKIKKSQNFHPLKNSHSHISLDQYIKKPLYDRLYRSNEFKKIHKEEHLNFIIKNTCPFQPKILEKSRKMAKSLNKEKEVFSRLCYSSTRTKRSKSFESNSLNLYNFSSNPNLSSNNFSNKNTRNNFNNIINKNYKILPKKKNLQFNSPRTKITIREIREENKLYDSIDKLNNHQDNLKKSFNKKYNDDLGKFKMNNFKEIFEIIYNNCKNVKDFQNMERFGIPKNIKEKLILPACFIIKERNLEFNFQNFYLIANEIMNFIL